MKEYEFTDQDFEHLRRFIAHKTGIAIAENKRELVYGRIARRLRATGLDSFAEYRRLLESGHSEELEEFINVITTNLTSFFRERHHFDYLRDTLLPELLQKHRHRRLRIWSAGCSTGEEAYSIAISALECRQVLAARDRIQIIATDLDSSVVAKARSGVYEQERIESLDRQLVKKYFLKGRGHNAGRVRIKPEVAELIEFSQLNLMEPWPFDEPFDVIFCRNVIIYFDLPTQARLVDRFAGSLDPNGYLFIGHSETLNKVSDRFELLGKTIYRRVR